MPHGEYEIVCKKECGFRVTERYFVEKPRFSPGICARCGSEVVVVKYHTNTVVPSMLVSFDDGHVYEEA